MQILALPSPYTDIVVIISMSLMTAFFALVRPELILKIIPFSLALTAFYVTLGTKWPSDKLVPLIFSVGCCMYLMRYNLPTSHLIPKNHIFKLLVLISISAIWGFIYLPDCEINAPAMQMPEIRTIVRIIYYIAAMAYFLAPLIFLPLVTDKLSPLKMYVYAGTVLAVYAVYQYIAYHIGLPYRGIKYWEDHSGFGGLETMSGLFRANGLANEPKQLSMYCVTAGLCSYVLSRTVTQQKMKLFVLTVLQFVGFLLAFSGSGFLAVMLFLMAMFFIFLKQADKKYQIPWMQILLAIPLLIALTIASGYWTKVQTFTNAITFDRVKFSISDSGSAVEERIDNYLLLLFVQNPSFILTGCGMGNQPYWVFDKYHVGIHPTRGISPADSGWLNLLADFGITSIIIFIIIIRGTIRDYLYVIKNDISSDTRTGIIISFYSVLLSVCLMFFVGAFNLLVFWLGMFYAFRNSAVNEIKPGID